MKTLGMRVMIALFALIFSNAARGQSEDIFVAADGTVAQSTLVPAAGAQYDIIITGTYRFRYATTQPGEFADAQYRESAPNQFTTRYNSVAIDGTQRSADMFDTPNHFYTYVLVGDGAAVTFRIVDDHYPDNVGGLTATIEIRPLVVNGTCMEPGPPGLVPCTAGTMVTAFLCTDRSCATLTALDVTQTDANGQFVFLLDGRQVAGKRLVFDATIVPAGALTTRDRAASDTTVDYQIIDFGPAANVASLNVMVDPASEAAVRLVTDNGPQHYTDSAIQDVIHTVRTADENSAFAGVNAADAATMAAETACQDAAVLAALQNQLCVGDCSGDRLVMVDELLTLVNIALGRVDAGSCTAGDPNGTGQIVVDQILRGVGNAVDPLNCAMVDVMCPLPPPGPVITGTVRMPNGQVVRNEGSLLHRFALLILEKAEALTGSAQPVGRGVAVQLAILHPDGVSEPLASGFTNDSGQYHLRLPSFTSENTCRLVVSVGDVGSGTLTRAFVFSTTESVDIDFASEAAVRLTLSAVAAGADLCSLSPPEISDILDAIRGLPGIVSGNNVSQVNLSAEQAAAAAPAVQATVSAALATPTPSS